MSHLLIIPFNYIVVMPRSEYYITEIFAFGAHTKSMPAHLSLESIEQNGPGIAYLFDGTGMSIDLVGVYQQARYFKGITLEQRTCFLAGVPSGIITTLRQTLHEHHDTVEHSKAHPDRVGNGIRPVRYAGAVLTEVSPTEFTIQTLSLVTRWYRQCLEEGSTYTFSGLNPQEAAGRLAIYSNIEEQIHLGNLTIDETTGSVYVDGPDLPTAPAAASTAAAREATTRKTR
jgi:hypothetical protein